MARKTKVFRLLFQSDSRKPFPSAINSTATFGEMVQHSRYPKRLRGRLEKKFLILCGATLACLLEAFARVFTKMICLVHGTACDRHSRAQSLQVESVAALAF